jgi:predicted transcriptional regulator
MTNSTVANNFNSISYEVISIEKLKQLITDPNTSYQLMRYYIDELEETEALLSH